VLSYKPPPHQELEAPKDVKVGFYAAGKRVDITMKPNEKTLAYDGTVTAPSSATFIVTGARLPQIWATTPEGAKTVSFGLVVQIKRLVPGSKAPPRPFSDIRPWRRTYRSTRNAGTPPIRKKQRWTARDEAPFVGVD
jgi:hypothetical protein